MMTDGSQAKIPGTHLFGGILAVALLVLHFLSFSEMYIQLVTTGITFQSFGAGKVLAANLIMFLSILGALACLVLAAIRSFRATAGTTFLPSVLLLGAGYALPWLGITLGWLVGGDV